MFYRLRSLLRRVFRWLLRSLRGSQPKRVLIDFRDAEFVRDTEASMTLDDGRVVWVDAGKPRIRDDESILIEGPYRTAATPTDSQHRVCGLCNECHCACCLHYSQTGKPHLVVREDDSDFQKKLMAVSELIAKLAKG